MTSKEENEDRRFQRLRQLILTQQRMELSDWSTWNLATLIYEQVKSETIETYYATDKIENITKKMA